MPLTSFHRLILVGSVSAILWLADVHGGEPGDKFEDSKLHMAVRVVGLKEGRADAGSPLELEVRVENRSRSSVVCSRLPVGRLFALEIHRKQGADFRSVAATEHIKSVRKEAHSPYAQTGKTLDVPPKHVLVARFPLQRWADVSRPGTYRIRVRGLTFATKSGATRRIESSVIQFELRSPLDLPRIAKIEG